MRVDPARLAELARSSEDACLALADDWQEALVPLEVACSGLGNAASAYRVARSYDMALASADTSVASLLDALRSGVGAVLDAARDATTADDVVASHLTQVRGQGVEQSLGHGTRGVGHGTGRGDGGSA